MYVVHEAAREIVNRHRGVDEFAIIFIAYSFIQVSLVLESMYNLEGWCKKQGIKAKTEAHTRLFLLLLLGLSANSIDFFDMMYVQWFRFM